MNTAAPAIALDEIYSESDGRSSPRSINTSVIIAETTWLSVRDEKNIPIEMSDAPSMKNPNKAEYALKKLTFPYAEKISGYNHIRTTGTAVTAQQDKNFPITTPDVFIGRE